MLPEFEFTLPACGKTLTWKPLSVGASLDVTAANRATPDNTAPALLVRRIIRYDGKDGPPTVAQWREWEEGDIEEFAAEVNEKESARKAMFRKKRASGDIDGMFTIAVVDVQQSLANLGRALTALVEAHEMAKAAKVPLE